MLTDPLGGGAEDGDCACIHQVPHDRVVWVEGGPVIEDQGAASSQGSHLPVPHHPAYNSQQYYNNRGPGSSQ